YGRVATPARPYRVPIADRVIVKGRTPCVPTGRNHRFRSPSIHHVAWWLYFTLYCNGDIPVIFLKVVRNALVSVYPTWYITSLTFSREVSNRILAASIFTR